LQLEPLLLRASPFNGWCSMVDAPSKAALTPLRSRARVHPEKSPLTGAPQKKSSVNMCEPAVV